MLLIFMVILLVRGDVLAITIKGDLESSLKERLGDRYYTVYDYKSFKVPVSDYIIIIPKYAETNDISIPSLEGTQEEILQKALDYMKEYSYTKNVSELSVLDLTGSGNCQALSLMFKLIMDKYGIQNEMVGDSTHVYNKVVISDKIYTIDLSNGSINLE